MSVIINPNEPAAARQAKSELDMILDTMRIIGEFRKAYMLLEDEKKINGKTIDQYDDLSDKQELICVNMVRFIIEGKLPHE